ncbi:2-octaprenyl-6-methoxyphenyl hydroxylase [Marinobacteraceae bacterium S3BR75-40.1]
MTATTAAENRRLDTDILIAGGGMAGATLALLLAQRCPQLRVTVVEPADLPPDPDPQAYQPSYDARSTALAYGTRQIYAGLGLWEAIAERATPIREVHVSYRGRFGESRLRAEEEQVPALGYVVDNRWLGINLLKALRGHPGIKWLCPASVEQVGRQVDGVSVTLSGRAAPEGLTARLLVVADGGRSGLKEALGFETSTHDYGQQAVIANVSTAKPHDFQAFERFTDNGPVALLPRGPVERAAGESALVWTLASAQAEEVLQLDDSDFLRRLQDQFGWRLGRLTKVGQRQAYPLQLRQVAAPCQPGIALVGNAAHSLHPVAGQGFNLAVRGLQRLAAAIEEGAGRGRVPGDLAVLTDYWEQQQGDVAKIAGFSGLLAEHLDSAKGWLGTGRDAGLVALDLLDGPRHWFARQAMGLR